MVRLRNLIVGGTVCWVAFVMYLCATLQTPAPPSRIDEELVVEPPFLSSPAATPNAVVLLPGFSMENTSSSSHEGFFGGNDTADDAAEALNGTSIAAAARSRVVAEAAKSTEEEDEPEHLALQDSAVALLTAQSECGIQTFTGRRSSRASSIYADDSAAKHGPSLAFDADSATSFHSACGLPMAPWWLSYKFAEPTTVSTIKLASDAPADYPKAWELQGRPFLKALQSEAHTTHACTLPCACIHCTHRPTPRAWYRLLGSPCCGSATILASIARRGCGSSRAIRRGHAATRSAAPIASSYP